MSDQHYIKEISDEEIERLINSFPNREAPRIEYPELTSKQYSRESKKIKDEELQLVKNRETTMNPNNYGESSQSSSNEPKQNINEISESSVEGNDLTLEAPTTTTDEPSQDIDIWLMKYKLDNSLSWRSVEILSRVFSELGVANISLSKYYFKKGLGSFPLKACTFVCRSCHACFPIFPSSNTCLSCSKKVFEDDYFLNLDIFYQFSRILTNDNISKIVSNVSRQRQSFNDISRGMQHQRITDSLKKYEVLSDKPKKNNI